LKKPCFVSAVPLFICAAISFSTCQETGLLSRVARNYGGDVSLSTSFDVKIFWKIREKEETKHGKIVCTPGDRFRIELGDSRWVCDGTTMWQYDKTPSPQVIIRRLSSCDQSQLPSRILSKYLTRYSFKELGTKGKNTMFSWASDSTAAPSKGEPQRIAFTVDRKSAVVQELTVVDKSGNESTYTFHATTFGTQPASAFSFDIPKGTRVLDETQ
jgi:outer membrane lipoprotein-sorting protein